MRRLRTRSVEHFRRDDTRPEKSPESGRRPKLVPQFFVEMTEDGTFKRLLRAGLEDGLATLVEYYDGVSSSWIAERELVHAWWFDRSRWRPISMGRALAVIELLQREDDVPVSVPPSSVHAIRRSA